MIAETRTLMEIQQQVIHLLYKEMGGVDAVRFLRQLNLGYGNYTDEREEQFDNVSLDDIMSAIETRRKTTT